MQRAYVIVTVVAALASGCGSESSSGGGTFECRASTGSASAQCQYNTQYCRLTTQGGTTTPSCHALPAGCPSTGSPCSCISSSLDGGTSSCSSIAIGGQRQTTVTVSQ